MVLESAPNSCPLPNHHDVATDKRGAVRLCGDFRGWQIVCPRREEGWNAGSARDQHCYRRLFTSGSPGGIKLSWHHFLRRWELPLFHAECEAKRCRCAL